MLIEQLAMSFTDRTVTTLDGLLPLIHNANADQLEDALGYLIEQSYEQDGLLLDGLQLAFSSKDTTHQITAIVHALSGFNACLTA